MTAAENRRRLAALRSAPTVKVGLLPPGMTGAEVLALRKLTPTGARAQADFKGGWQSPEQRRRFSKVKL